MGTLMGDDLEQNPARWRQWTPTLRSIGFAVPTIILTDLSNRAAGSRILVTCSMKGKKGSEPGMRDLVHS